MRGVLAEGDAWGLLRRVQARHARQAQVQAVRPAWALRQDLPGETC